MNDPVTVIPAGNMPPPPSYIRPPLRPSSFREKKHDLMLWTGIAATVLSIWGFMLFGGGLGAISVEPIKGSLAFVASEPELGVYQIALGEGATEPSALFEESFDSTEEFRGASFSPSGKIAAVSIIDSDTGEPAMYLVSPDSGARSLVVGGAVDTIFTFPVVANGGDRVVFTALVPPSGATKELESSALLAERTDGLFTVRPIPDSGAYVAFSPDKSRLMMTPRSGPSLYSIADGVISKVEGAPLVSGKYVIGVSPDGGMAAIGGGSVVSWGAMDWMNSRYEEKGTVPRQARALFFTQSGELVVVTADMVYGYRLDGSQARAAGAFSIVLPAQSVPVSWLP